MVWIPYLLIRFSCKFQYLFYLFKCGWVCVWFFFKFKFIFIFLNQLACAKTHFFTVFISILWILNQYLLFTFRQQLKNSVRFVFLCLMPGFCCCCLPHILWAWYLLMDFNLYYLNVLCWAMHMHHFFFKCLIDINYNEEKDFNKV